MNYWLFRNLILKVMLRNLAIQLVILMLVACEKDISLNPELEKYVEKVVIAALGGTINTSDSVKLIIPPYAFPFDVNVSIGRTGDEPSSVPNGDLEIVGSPVTLKIQSDTLYKPIKLSFPVSAGSLSPDKHFVFLYNGSSYFPVEYTVIGSRVIVTIDIINWEYAAKKSSTRENILNILLIIKQTPPDSEIGLKEISIVDGKMQYAVPNASQSAGILLLVHGWTARPKVWTEFIQKIQQETDLPYSDIWTFGYNSSWGIQQNAEILAQQIGALANEAHIDIVAHSMGGLVSRSMIEQFGGAEFINKLITIGTPHEGSPLAVSRYLLGAIVKTTGDDEDYILYNHVSQGFNDLNTNSSFIAQMEELESPPLPYYAIAATNDPSLWKQVSGQILSGPDDGIVAVSSALGVQGAITPELNNEIPVALAHMKMTKDDSIYEQVLAFLRRK
jgi:pimeloyl-ACP methyl ester carboxylesterase